MLGTAKGGRAGEPSPALKKMSSRSQQGWFFAKNISSGAFNASGGSLYSAIGIAA